jgi:phosphate transport system substrate-binding protein
MSLAMNRLFQTLWSLLLVVAALCIVTTQSPAQSGAPYHTSQSVSGTIRISGDEFMSAVTKNWADEFRKHHPEVRFEIKLMGTATAMPAIYTNQADLALLGRENNTTDDNGFLHVLHYPPLRFELMTGSLDVPGKSYALAIFVHKDNPLSKLTMAQLDAIFGCEHRNGLDNIRTWGQLGLIGEWKDKPINLYSYDAETGTGLFFLHAALADSRKMNWKNLKEFKDIKSPNGSTYEGGQQIIDALQRDRFGLAVSSLRYANAQVRTVAIAAKDGGPYYLATKENLITRQYPLTRVTYAFINQPPGKPFDPKVKEFLRFVFGPEGQADILKDDGYLPLSQEAILQQLKKLNQ